MLGWQLNNKEPADSMAQYRHPVVESQYYHKTESPHQEVAEI
jgi:hypothetical protein